MNSGSVPYHFCLEVLGNPLRIGILKLLSEKPSSVSEIAERLGEEQSKVSHSLSALKKCSFVESKRKGKSIVYSLREGLLKKMEGKNLFEALERHYEKHGKTCWKCRC